MTTLGALDPPHLSNSGVFAPTGQALFPKGMKDHDNVAPRVGFTYDVTGKQDFVIRGGAVTITTPS